MNRFLLFCVVLMFVVPLINGYGKISGDNIVTIQILETSGATQKNVSLTFGHVFIKGEVPGDAVLEAELSDGSSVPLQVDKKAYHSDGSLRHAVFTTILPELESNGTKDLILRTASSQLPGDPVRAIQVLATDYDAVVSLNIGGTLFTASARDLLQNDTSSTWLSGPLVTEWLVYSPVKDGNGNPHPHLTARFNIRAYTGLSSIRTDVILENNWSFVSSPQNFSYDVSITISGKNVVFTQNDVTHYRQARWRRVFWWGTMPQIHIKNDARYLMKTGAVPTYDTTLVVPEYSLDDMVRKFNAGSDLMKIGYLDPYMPSG